MLMSSRRHLIADKALNERLRRFVGARLSADDVGDVVQATLTEALAAKNAPESEEELTKWIFGIARNEIADHFRKRRREVPADLDDEEAEPASDGSAKSLLRWANAELPPGSENEKTLEWMLLEGDGEKLEHIAEESDVPPARVRKRVSRLRQHFRVRYAAALALVAVAVVIAVLALRKKEVEEVAPVPSSEKAPKVPELTPETRAHEIRELAFRACDRASWQECLDRLDEAKAIDPVHDDDQRVQTARKSAAAALRPPPPIAPTATVPPVATSTTPPRSTAPTPTPTVAPTVGTGTGTGP
ncbi:hypothetical protein BH09MYX1_BH09MYX1_48000 [soil metagenome]